MGTDHMGPTHKSRPSGGDLTTKSLCGAKGTGVYLDGSRGLVNSMYGGRSSFLPSPPSSSPSSSLAMPIPGRRRSSGNKPASFNMSKAVAIPENCQPSEARPCIRVQTVTLYKLPSNCGQRVPVSPLAKTGPHLVFGTAHASPVPQAMCQRCKTLLGMGPDRASLKWESSSVMCAPRRAFATRTMRSSGTPRRLCLNTKSPNKTRTGTVPFMGSVWTSMVCSFTASRSKSGTAFKMKRS